MKTKIISVIICLFSLTLAGCDDGVPKVDDPAKPVVNGKEMTTKEFLNTYCVAKGAGATETCKRVYAENAKQSTRVMPHKW